MTTETQPLPTDVAGLRALSDTDGENKAVRWFLAGYGGGMRHTVGNMKTHLKNCGYPFWPAWADGHEKDVQHLTKGGAQLWLRHLFDLEIADARAQAAPAADYDHGPQSTTVNEAARHVGKWLNERPNRPLDLRDVAMLVAHVQAPAAGAVAEPVAWRVRRLDSPNYWIIFLHKPVDALMDPEREVQPLYTAQSLAMGRVPQVDAAAKALAECMDYPWEHMPEAGRQAMREHAQKVLSAADDIKQGDNHG